MGLLTTNQLARAFYDDVYATPHNQANLARFNFLDPAFRRFYPDWDQAADIALTCWYKPQWLFEQVPMTEVKLPAYEEGCDAEPEKAACAYPHTPCGSSSTPGSPTRAAGPPSS